MRFGRSICYWALAAACVAPLVRGQSTRSPFLPPATEAGPAVTEDAPLQFCGYIGEGDARRFCVYDPTKRRSTWLRAGEQQGDVQLQSFDAENRTVSVVQNGRSMTLRLQSAKVASGGGNAGGGPLPIAGASPGNNPLVNTVVTNPTPADEARRLEAVAAEVRRRRALRQAAAQNQAPAPGADAGAPAPR